MRTPWWVVSEANVVSTCHREVQAVQSSRRGRCDGESQDYFIAVGLHAADTR